VALLTGGSDKPYVFGLTMSLLSQGFEIDMIGSEELDLPEFRNRLGLRLLKLRGSQHSDARIVEKMGRICSYYAKLIKYAVTANAEIFHILWNNRFETFDRTVLMALYRALGKKVVLTAHNVNAGKRDGRDGILNRATLKVQYRLAHKIFVHTEKMKEELAADFDVSGDRVAVIPFGINNSVPQTDLTPSEAKLRLGLADHEKAILCFGRITPYKGIEYLIGAF